MVKTSSSIKLALLTLLGVVATFGAAAQEADDNRDWARAGYLDFPMETVISSEEDVDVFRPGRFTIKQSTENTAGNYMSVAIEGAAGTLDVPPAAASGENEVSQSLLVEPGELFIGFSGPDRDLPYEFEMRFRELTTAEAFWRVAGDAPEAEGTFPVNLEASSTPRMFTVTMDEMGVLEILYEHTAEGDSLFGAHAVERGGDSSQIPVYPFWHSEEGVQRALLTLDAGEYDLSLYRYSGQKSEAIVTFAQPGFGDAFEPNDSAELARPLPFNTRLSGVQTYRGDVDWFLVDVPQAGKLEFAFAAIEPADGGFPTAYLYRDEQESDRVDHASWNPGIGVLTFDIEPGSYYLVLSGPDTELLTEMTAIYTPAAETGDENDPDTRFYMIGLAEADNEALQDAVASIAESGGGSTIALSSSDMELGLRLAEIVSDSENRGLSMLGYARATSQVIVQRLFSDPEKTMTEWISEAPTRFAERDVLEPQDSEEGDLAATQAARFRARMLQYYQTNETE